jgi:hypothetical protein
MKVLKTIGLGILYFIGIVIITMVVIFAMVWGYFSAQLFMFCKGDYLLFVAGDLNMIPIIMIIILIIFVLFRIKERLFNRKNEQIEIIDKNDEPLDSEELGKSWGVIFKLLNGNLERDEKILKVSKIIKMSYILVLIVVTYLGMTSYAILYPESIKVSSPLAPTGLVYKYSDIKNINVGILRGSKNSYSPYYKVIFNDGKSADFFDVAMQESKGVRFEYILIDLDEKLRTQGVVKTVDKENFQKYSEGLDIDFVSRVEKLFD